MRDFCGDVRKTDARVDAPGGVLCWARLSGREKGTIEFWPFAGLRRDGGTKKS